MNKIILLITILAIVSGTYFYAYRQGLHSVSADASTAQLNTPPAKILYYRNPMGLADTSETPKKDAMGMDYIPVYEGESNGVQLRPEQIQKLGVTSEAAGLHILHQSVSASGRIEMDERHVYNVSPKFEGWVEKLYVSSTGQSVKSGQALFDAYSPELNATLNEHALAAEGTEKLEEGVAKNGMQQLADASLVRLKNWGVSQAPGEHSKRSMSYASPVSGIVTEKNALQGMRFAPGDVLYRIADLSSVWVVADIAEQDIGALNVGSTARITVNAYPSMNLQTTVDFIYPVMNPATRTVGIRLTLANPRGLLKPNMYARVDIASIDQHPVLSVPLSAIIDKGQNKIVLIRKSQGSFVPREVKTGRQDDAYVEIRDGLSIGEQIVTSANFLIDSESNLNAALSRMDKTAGQEH